MTVISKSKILPWADVFPQIEEIVSNQTDTPFCVSIPYGLQLQKHLWNPERLRVVRHVKSGTGHSFISHHGVGKNNEINIWNFSKEKQPGNLAAGIQSVSTDLMFLHILFSQRRWVYVTYCNDMSMRVFSAKFHLVSTTSVKKTILSLAYNEIRDEIITGIAGGIMTWKFSVGQQDPLIPGQLISCSFEPFDWVMSLTIDNRSQQILAISDVRISMIYLHNNQERCFFQKKCDFSFTTCAFYNPASYFITGKTKAWRKTAFINTLARYKCMLISCFSKVHLRIWLPKRSIRLLTFLSLIDLNILVGVVRDHWTLCFGVTQFEFLLRFSLFLKVISLYCAERFKCRSALNTSSKDWFSTHLGELFLM